MEPYLPDSPLFNHVRKEEAHHLRKTANWQGISLLFRTFLATALVLLFTRFSPFKMEFATQAFCLFLANSASFLPYFFSQKIHIKNLFSFSPQKEKWFWNPKTIFAAMFLCLGMNNWGGIIAQILAKLLPGGENSASSFHLSGSSFPLELFFYFVCLSLVAPLTEELMFRGGMLMPLRRYGDGFAIVLSALFFGLIHGNLSQIPSTFAMGLLFAYVAVKTDSLWPSIFLHFFNNTFVVLSEILRLQPSNFYSVFFRLLSLFSLFCMVFTIVFLLRAKPWRKLDNDYQIPPCYQPPNKLGIYFSSPAIWALSLLILYLVIRSFL